MKIESKTAQESWLIASAAKIENYKNSFDAVINHMLKEINSAANKGEFSVKIKIAPLEKFIGSSDFANILNDVYRILTNNSGLGYDINQSPTEWIISWEQPIYSNLDINLPYPYMGGQVMTQPVQ